MGCGRPGRPSPAGQTRAARASVARLRARSRGGGSALSGLEVASTAGPRAPGPIPGALSASFKPIWTEATQLWLTLSRPLGSGSIQRAEPPSALPRRVHWRAKPRLSTDNETFTSQHGRSRRMRARLGGRGAVNGWAKPRPSSRPYWQAPRFWARPLTDLSHCDRWKSQFLLGRGRSQRLAELRPASRALLLLLLTPGRAAGVRRNVIAVTSRGAASVRSCSSSGALVPSALAAAAAALGTRMASGALGPSELRERRSRPLRRRRLSAAASTPRFPASRR